MAEDLVSLFKRADISSFPDFYSYEKPLERSLWALWVCKEKLSRPRLTAEEIAEIITRAKEISTEAKSITRSLLPAKGKRHIWKVDGRVYFEIMEPGKTHLLSLVKSGSIEIFYFEANRKYTSRVLSKNLLSSLNGELKVVDPYCGLRALEMLKDTGQTVKFLTQISKLREDQKREFLRDLPDFKSEFTNVKIRDYHGSELHDRYVISDDRLVIFGQSIKDLGSKESFAVSFTRKTTANIISSLIDSFDQRWNSSADV